MWKKDRINEIITDARHPSTGGRLTPDDADQLEALLAEVNRLERELNVATETINTERDAHEAKLQQVIADRDLFMERWNQVVMLTRKAV